MKEITSRLKRLEEETSMTVSKRVSLEKARLGEQERKTEML
jgi:hypothetical protein